MKRRFILASIILISCIASEAIDYRVEGKLEVADGTKVYMSDYMMNGFFPIDSVEVRNGRFIMEGSYERQADVRIETADFRQFSSGILDTLLILNFQTHLPEESSSELNQRLIHLVNNLNEMNEELELFAKELASHGFEGDELGDLYSKLYYKIRPRYYDALMNSLKENNDNGIGEEMILRTGRIWLTPEEWDEFYSVLSDRLKELPGIQSKNLKFQKQRKSQPGNMFTDFKGKTIDGGEIFFSDIIGKGKYVLVDFWASWCSPCLEEGRKTLIPLYEKYGNNENFEILGVAVWDKEEKTRQRLEQQGYKWPQILDAGMTPMDEYGFDAIPMIMLFDPDGVILERNIRGSEIESSIEKYLKK